MSLMNGKKGQLSVINLVTFLILIVVGVVVTYVANPIISDAMSSSNNSLTQTMMALIVPGMWLAIFITIFVYATPQRPQQPY